MREITVKDIWEARKRIQCFIQPTPLIPSTILSQQHHASIHLKLETLHETGAFKVRGATNKILTLSEEQKGKGVTTFSTGNHGLAVAWMAKKLGIKAVICISNRVPDSKVEAFKQYGADIKRVGSSQDDAEEYCYQLEKKSGLAVIKPFDDREVIAGQGTIGLELIEAIPTMDSVVIPLSGGGLFAGIALALKSYNPKIQVIGVSMERGAVMAASLKAGKPVVLQEEDTLADSLLGGIGNDNQYTFHMVRQWIDQMVHVSEQEIVDAMAFLLKHHGIVAEGAAATGVAAIRSGKIVTENKQIATIITGKNVGMPVLAEILQHKYR